MLKATLDRNCLISLKEKDGEFEEIQEIIELHKKKSVAVFVCAISASEYQSDGGVSPKYDDFTNYLKSIGCETLDEIEPMAYWDIAYWDHALWSGDSMKEFEQKIHEILFPNLEFEYQAFCKAKGIDPDVKPLDKKWLNAKADVQSIWSHINSGNDIFITQDKNYLKDQKRQLLVTLGAKNINSPKEALEMIRRNGT